MNIAIFDLDHTLIRLDSTDAWANYMVDHGLVSDVAAFDSQLNHLWSLYDAGHIDMDGYLRLILAPLAGHNVNYINQLINDYLTRWVKPTVYQQGIKLINEYKRRGDAVFLLSASIDVLVQPIGYHMFGIDHADIAAVETIKEQGVFTGQYVKPIPFGQGKLGRFRQLLADRPYLEQTVFYTDSLDDLPLLQQVDQPVVVNGSAQLLALAYQKGWSTMHLTQ